MKKLYTLFMVSAIAFTANSQLVFKEGFSGYTGTTLGNQFGWMSTGATTPDVQVTPFPNATELTYPGYNAGFGTYLSVARVAGRSPHKKLLSGVSTSGNTTTTYVAFLVRVTDAEASNNAPAYSMALYDTTGLAGLERPLRFFIAKDPANSSRVRFGIATGTVTNGETYSSTAMNYSIGTTYFIVIRYDIVNGFINDKAYLYVNPNTVLEPATASAIVTVNSSLIYPESLLTNAFTAVELSQSGTSVAAASYDGFMIANNASSAVAWALISGANASLPVTLTSFNAAQDGLNNTKLAWNVADENGIESYVIEKSTDGQHFTAVGTVAASGNTNYNFTDVQAVSDKTYYRLKMVEADGTFKISNIVSLKATLSTSISLSPNPVTNSLMIQHPKVTGDARIQLMNASGQFIREFRLATGAVLSTINMSGLTTGMYHVVYKNGTDVFTKTVLKK
jgi:hypothetical protein